MSSPSNDIPHVFKDLCMYVCMLALQKIELACVTLIRSAKPGTFQRNSVCFAIAKKNRLKLCSFAFVNTYFSAFCLHHHQHCCRDHLSCVPDTE